MTKLRLTSLLLAALILPTTASGLDALGLRPYVAGDFAAPMDQPGAWPLRLWPDGESFDGAYADDATTVHWAYAFGMRPDADRFDPGQSLYLVVGGNDIYHDDWHTSYETNMLYIITRALELGLERVVIVSSPQNFAWVDNPPLHAIVNDMLGYFAEVDARICAMSEVVYCVDVFELLDSPEHYQPDGLHLSDQGHQVVADAYLTQVPEPSATALLAAGLLFLPLLQRASRRRQGTQG